MLFLCLALIFAILISKLNFIINRECKWNDARKIAIDMDEVLADTLGEIIDAVNERANLGITIEALKGKN